MMIVRKGWIGFSFSGVGAVWYDHAYTYGIVKYTPSRLFGPGWGWRLA